MKKLLPIFLSCIYGLATPSVLALEDREALVPLPSLDSPLCDQDLYERYKFNKKEISFIESMVREMD